MYDDVSTIRKPDSLRSYVESYLREAITSGRFKPGERIVEREICEMLEVSRPPVREALRKLEAEKLITTLPRRGPVVASISSKEASDLYAIRALMESYAVAEFARLATDSDIEQLGEAVKALHDNAKSGDRKGLLAAKAQFYDVILNNCGNDLVREMLLGLLTRINLLRSASFSSPDRLPKSLAEIDEMYSLIKARDAARAGEIARLHVSNAEKAAMVVLEQQVAADSSQ
ncbi:GntR family transcriptional regulator [Noviherbaspirillum denitrificans]|uniref:GntR family transcriptional regulator n=2 Tax=Noviherbaspirillum denitrificans TaxID=1968433 RepID=A0A254TCM0_9BURK|nr:GntR family transcriptional regulator [Noviherbaspirillum denitrificans]OWW20380.1 GntR family transcriptional regulator [Noviherbaspirillum denitrificans]